MATDEIDQQQHFAVAAKLVVCAVVRDRDARQIHIVGNVVLHIWLNNIIVSIEPPIYRRSKEPAIYLKEIHTFCVCALTLSPVFELRLR